MLRRHESMAAHAPFDRRHPGKRGSPHAAVAYLARETIRLEMIAMMEVNRLYGRVRRRGSRPGDRDGSDDGRGRRCEKDASAAAYHVTCRRDLCDSTTWLSWFIDTLPITAANVQVVRLLDESGAKPHQCQDAVIRHGL